MISCMNYIPSFFSRIFEPLICLPCSLKTKCMISIHYPPMNVTSYMVFKSSHQTEHSGRYTFKTASSFPAGLSLIKTTWITRPFLSHSRWP